MSDKNRQNCRFSTPSSIQYIGMITVKRSETGFLYHGAFDNLIVAKQKFPVFHQ
jgi:hypothetical protein